MMNARTLIRDGHESHVRHGQGLSSLSRVRRVHLCAHNRAL